MTPDKLLYSATEARATLGIGLTGFYQLIHDRKLDARRIGHRTFVTAKSINEFIELLPRAVTPTMLAKGDAGQGVNETLISNLEKSPSRHHRDKRVADVVATRRRNAEPAR